MASLGYLLLPVSFVSAKHFPPLSSDAQTTSNQTPVIWKSNQVCVYELTCLTEHIVEMGECHASNRSAYCVVLNFI